MENKFPQMDKRSLDLMVYKGKEDILIVPYDYSTKGLQFASKRHIKLRVPFSSKELGEKILEAIEGIKISPLDTRCAYDVECDFLELTGYKSFSAFAKKYDAISFLLTEEEDYYIGASAKKGAEYCGERITKLRIPITSTMEEIGNTVFSVFQEIENYYKGKEKRKKQKNVFDILSGAKISFEAPSDEVYTDEEDYGAAEIYQGYSYHKDDAEESVADMYFSIAADLYCDTNPEHIQSVYEAYDGEAESFSCVQVDHPVFEQRIEMETAKVHRIVYLKTVDESELLDCELVIKKKLAGKRLHDKIIKDFEKMVKSCK